VFLLFHLALGSRCFTAPAPLCGCMFWQRYILYHSLGKGIVMLQPHTRCAPRVHEPGDGARELQAWERALGLRSNSQCPLLFAASQCQGVVTLSAQRVATVQGRASVTLTPANTTGACRLAVRVDNVTQELDVAVLSPPDPLDKLP
jgi:hypothetical protein